MKMLGLGVIGCGEIAYSYHLPALQRVQGARLVAVASRSPNVAKQAAQDFNAAKYYTSAHDLLADPDIEAVLLLTPNYSRVELISAAALAGKAMLIQKPLARNLNEAKEISRIVADTKVLAVPSFMHRYFPEVLKAREYINQGVLGDVHMIRMRNATPGSSWSSWFFRKEFVGGGAAIDIGVHGIDLIRWLISDIRTVCAVSKTLVSERVIHGERIKPDNEDTVIAIYELQNGAICSHEISWTQIEGYKRFEMEIYGSEGSILIRSGIGPLCIASRKLNLDGQWLLPDLPRQFLGVVHHQDFVQAVREAPTSLTALLQDGVRSIEVVTALSESTLTGRTVSV